MKYVISKLTYLLTAVLLVGFSCNETPKAPETTQTTATQPQHADNQLSQTEQKDGWRLLFDGKTTDGWHLYNKGQQVSAWRVTDGALIFTPDENLERGDLVSDKSYENFHLKFDWNISKGGNSGVFINVQERPDIPTAWASGPEYQLLEQSHQDYSQPLKQSGCIFNIAAQKNSAVMKPLGEWNQSEIRQQDGKIEFYLNGVLTAQEDLRSSAWKEAIAKGGFKLFPEFGKQTKGKIALQQWLNGISFKNITIREL